MTAPFSDFVNGFEHFRHKFFDQEPKRFRALRDSQNPNALVIGCCDSRVNPVQMLNCEPGQLFVVRCIAGLVPHPREVGQADAVMAAVEYGVHHLKVEHIIVLGHAGCGGIQALLHPETVKKDLFIGQWVNLAQHAVMKAADEHGISSRRAEEAAVLMGVENLLAYPWIRERVEAGQLEIHAWYFDLRTGELNAYDGETERFQLVIDPTFNFDREEL